MKRLSAFVHRIAKSWVVLLSLVLFVLTTAVLFPFFADLLHVPEEAESIDTQFFYSPDRLYEIISAYDAQGRRGYALSHLTADLIFPLVYTFLFSTAISFTFRRAFPVDSPLQRLNLMPFGLMAADLIENTLLVALLLSFPKRLNSLAMAAGVVTAVKWLFSAAAVLLLFLGAAAWLGNAFRRKD